MLAALNERHRPVPGFEVCVFSDGTVFLDQVLEKAREGPNAPLEEQLRSYGTSQGQAAAVVEAERRKSS